eukprot:Phypoly_transcript_26639.p1 GENE.Phypoly_transcript_26639~~Phypoly_transcript_26639.p1  ORF type:complete len:130 (+),score=4.55 Phypoly_transcript_26639:48-437(+)
MVKALFGLLFLAAVASANYLHSCSNPSVNYADGVLSADCKNEAGTVAKTYIDLEHCIGVYNSGTILRKCQGKFMHYGRCTITGDTGFVIDSFGILVDCWDSTRTKLVKNQPIKTSEFIDNQNGALSCGC